MRIKAFPRGPFPEPYVYQHTYAIILAFRLVAAGTHLIVNS